jgi:multidrug efflux pump
MTSSSSFGISHITLQFDLNRDIDAAAQDVQALSTPPGRRCRETCSTRRVYSKVNPPDAPMVTLAITSDTISLRALSDIADMLLAQRLSELTGTGGVTVQRNASRTSCRNCCARCQSARLTWCTAQPPASERRS